MLVRRERASDVDAVREVVAAAFARDPATGADRPTGAGPPVEVWLLDQLRADRAWIPALSLVAVAPDGGDVTGHVVCTRATVDGRPALGLGPLAVRPDWQRRGVGTALMHAVLAAAEALDESLVGLLGDPDYYHRFGFATASCHHIASPEPAWGRYFQVRVLTGAAPPAGTFAYARPFQAL